MPPLTHRRHLAALALAAALALPWPAAATPQARHQPAAPGLLQQLWTALTAFWGAGVSPDSGCKMDPDGRCLPANALPAPTVTRDDGCKMDPSGGCLPRSAVPQPVITPDSGCSMDPNGGCLPGS
ncbi:MAG TPA: hypothetical protein VH988_11435 [Thermoanaerobaculia bacterium]|nr:hypothetical protein [Thermoanaerobaculia bacterium]